MKKRPILTVGDVLREKCGVDLDMLADQMFKAAESIDEFVKTEDRKWALLSKLKRRERRR